MPASLHNVFGQRQSFVELLGTLLFGLGVPLALTLLEPAAFHALPLWRSAGALLLVLDIAAGCAANFTHSTNDYYAARPRHRWVFIGLHFHLVGVALLLGDELAFASAIWAYTIAGAALLNLMKSNPLQTFAGGLLLAIGLVGMPYVMESSVLMRVVSTLFMLKVLFGFAVDHYGAVRPSATPA